RQRDNNVKYVHLSTAVHRERWTYTRWIYEAANPRFFRTQLARALRASLARESRRANASDRGPRVPREIQRACRHAPRHFGAALAARPCHRQRGLMATTSPTPTSRLEAAPASPYPDCSRSLGTSRTTPRDHYNSRRIRAQARGGRAR